MGSSAVRVGLAAQLQAVQHFIDLIKLPGLGRGLIAAHNIEAGTMLFQEQPMLCTSAPVNVQDACHNCTRPLPAHTISPTITTNAERNNDSAAFCSTDCETEAHSWQTIDQQCDFTELHSLCLENGEKFPLMLQKLACMSLAADNNETSAAPLQENTSVGNHTANEELYGGIVPRANALVDLKDLCFANIGSPPPQEWVHQHSALTQGLKGLKDRGYKGVEKLDVAWYCWVMARLHLNVFRVDTVAPIDMTNPAALLRAAASTISDSINSTQQSGSAAYLLSSMLNHSCEPNLDVHFPHNNATVGFMALRDIQKNEQLTISYIDVEMPVSQRRQRLGFSYGFECGCPRCLREVQGQ